MNIFLSNILFESFSGANVNVIRKRDLQTPLHVAAIVNCDQLVNLLVCNGADIHARDKQTKKPIDLADKESNAHTLLQTYMSMFIGQ